MQLVLSGGKGLNGDPTGLLEGKLVRESDVLSNDGLRKMLEIVRVHLCDKVLDE